VRVFKPSAAMRETMTLSHELSGAALRLAYDSAVFTGGRPSESLQAQFPLVRFRPLATRWTGEAVGDADVLAACADAASEQDVNRLCLQLRDCGRADSVIVFLRNPDVTTTRRILREGAADVLPSPAEELAVAVALERLLGRLKTEGARQPQTAGQVVALLKAGGGVGATALGAQLAAILAKTRGESRVCLVDLDVQFGQAAMYLDLDSSVTLGEVLAAGGDLAEIRFGASLTPHESGARVLAAPPQFLPLEALTPAVIDALIVALKREFDVIILDLPSAWTAWSNRALHQSDRIVLVTQLSVPHAHLTKRQLRLLETQRLDETPLTLVCNRCGGDSPAAVSVKAAEAAIGRRFDVQVPDDRKLMNEAINQGVAIGSLRRGSKLEKGLEALAACVSPAPVATPRGWRS